MLAFPTCTTVNPPFQGARGKRKEVYLEWLKQKEENRRKETKNKKNEEKRKKEIEIEKSNEKAEERRLVRDAWDAKKREKALQGILG